MNHGVGAVDCLNLRSLNPLLNFDKQRFADKLSRLAPLASGSDALAVGVRLPVPSSFLSRDRTKRVRQAVPLQPGSAPRALSRFGGYLIMLDRCVNSW
jgi:hypothetical protein